MDATKYRRIMYCFIKRVINKPRKCELFSEVTLFKGVCFNIQCIQKYYQHNPLFKIKPNSDILFH